MKKCYECGKELKFWEGYRHPLYRKKELVCSECFDFLEKSMEQYRNFILSLFKQDEEKHVFNNLIIKLRQMVHHFGHKM
jgi:hypothetical protein